MPRKHLRSERATVRCRRLHGKTTVHQHGNKQSARSAPLPYLAGNAGPFSSGRAAHRYGVCGRRRTLARMPKDDDFIAAAAQPHCPNCGTVLHAAHGWYRCYACQLDVLPEA